MFGMTPGPFLFEKNPEFAWGLIASLFIGNLMMLILATFCMPAFIRIIKVRTPILNAIVMGCILIGAYALSSSMFDVYTAVIFGAIGFFFRKLEISPAPLVISLILGEITERKLRQAMTIARGDFWKVITQPIALVIYAIAIIIIFGGPVMKFVKGQLKKHKAQTAR
jgi:putative tricarboxylic transport membrane protein